MWELRLPRVLETAQLRHDTVRVTVEGKQVDAVALTPAPSRASTAGPVSEPYADALARGAKAAGLPAAYVARLEAEALDVHDVAGARMPAGRPRPGCR